MKIDDHRELLERQGARYRRSIGAWNRLEEAAFGVAMGSNGYTIQEEAEKILHAVTARANGRILDMGTGRGWPGRMIARETGRHVVAMDVPVDGLRHARDAFAEEGVSERSHVCAGSASELPFADRSFAAISHADVFC